MKLISKLIASGLSCALLALWLLLTPGTVLASYLSSTSVTSSPTGAVSYGSPIAFTATVVPQAGSPTPTGSIEFYDGDPDSGAVSLGQASVTSNGNGSASATLADVHTLDVDHSPHEIFAVYAGDTFVAGSRGEVSQAISKAPVTITAASRSTTYGRPVPQISHLASGLQNGQTLSVASDLPICSAPGVTSRSPTGSYDTTCDVSSMMAANYTFQAADGTLTVAPATITVAAGDVSMPYRAASLPVLTWSMAGLAFPDDGSTITGSPSCSVPGAIPDSPAGHYAVHCDVSSLAAPNYVFASQSGVLTIKRAPILVTTFDAACTFGSCAGAVAGLTGTVSGVFAGDTITATYSAATPDSPAAVYPVSAHLSDHGTGALVNYKIKQIKGQLTIHLAQPTLQYTGPMTLTHRHSVRVSATLLTPSGAGIPYRVIHFEIGSGSAHQHCDSHLTSAAGRAHCTIDNLKASRGNRGLTISFSGDRKGATHDYSSTARTIPVSVD